MSETKTSEPHGQPLAARCAPDVVAIPPREVGIESLISCAAGFQIELAAPFLRDMQGTTRSSALLRSMARAFTTHPPAAFALFGDMLRFEFSHPVQGGVWFTCLCAVDIVTRRIKHLRIDEQVAAAPVKIAVPFQLVRNVAAGLKTSPAADSSIRRRLCDAWPEGGIGAEPDTLSQHVSEPA